MITNYTSSETQYLERLAKNPQKVLDDIDRELAYRNLKDFVKLNWRTVETKPFVDGWHIGLLCDHLEAVTEGQIKRLIINIPPRHMKSLTTCVFWPSWNWLKDPGDRFLFSSYAETLSKRDSVKCRRVIQSPLYEEMLQMYQKDFVLTGDQNEKLRFENNFGGYRIATSVNGVGTGEGGDKIVVDDAHNVMEVESAVKRLSTLAWWDESMSTRLNDPETGVYVIIMHRSHENDLTGHCLEKMEEQGWEIICLPARYEGKSKIFTSLNVKDPRKRIDEPLWPERYNDEQLHDLEKRMSQYAIAGQLQQRPTPREGGVIPIDKLKLIKEYDEEKVLKVLRYWDKAGTEGAGARTAGVKICKMRDGSFVVADVVKGQWSAGKREKRIKQKAELDGEDVTVWTEQEPGSGGKESAENTVRNLAGFKIYAERVTGDKVVRAEPFGAQVEGGNVSVLIREWTDEYLEELELFPNGKFKDQVDASAGAFNKLNVKKKKAGTW